MPQAIAMKDIALAPFSLDIWRNKYAAPGEETPEDTWKRVATALANADTSPTADKAALARTFENGIAHNGLRPGGRIFAAADNPERTKATTINCTVSRAIEDSIEGIGMALSEALTTLSTGAGIGYNYSTLRPKGAPVNGIGGESGGVIDWIKIFEMQARSVVSGGGRRAAQLGALHCAHPDVFAFVDLKADRKVLSHHNISIGITDAFMEAVKADGEHKLIFPVHVNDTLPEGTETVYAEWPKPGPDSDYTLDAQGHYLCRVWETIRARDLWDHIMTYAHSESDPGVLFLDRINERNPLRHCEKIWTTNPCGEQPLPAKAACLLGSVDLTRHVTNPLTPEADFDLEGFAREVRVFSRALDNVVEINDLPLPGQREEIERKRRHGAGVMGVGSMLNLVGLRYGSPESVRLADRIARTLVRESWEAAVDLAEEKGPAPIFTEDPNHINQVLNSPYFRDLIDEGVLDGEWLARAHEHGLRYTHATSLAPTGTIALLSNNISNGIEPSFSHSYIRAVVGEAGEAKQTEEVLSLEQRALEQMHGKGAPQPDHWTSAADVTPDEHIAMQAAFQRWIDSAVSKTLNLPMEATKQDIADVYFKAWESGLKGFTIYHPTPDRAGVLIDPETLASQVFAFRTASGWQRFAGNVSVSHDRRPATIAAMLFEGLNGDAYAPGPVPADAEWPADATGRLEGRIMEWRYGDEARAIHIPLPPRPVVLDSKHWQINAEGGENSYVMIGHDEEGRLRECFIQSHGNACAQWANALTLTLSKVMAAQIPLDPILDELKKITDKNAVFGRSVTGETRHLGSTVAEIARAIEMHREMLDERHERPQSLPAAPTPMPTEPAAANGTAQAVYEVCPACGVKAMENAGGCKTCKACGESECG